MENNHLIELVKIHKVFDDEVVLHSIDLYIRKKEFLTLLGPSGCGKTTSLRIIAGFETATSGSLLFDGTDISNIPPHRRNINTVFQSYALFPHMDVYENIAFGLKIKKEAAATIKEKVSKMLELVNLSGFENRSVKSLSGGQQQRIAIARALVNEPKVLLLDEPLGALDLKLRKEMQTELKNMQRQLGITFVYVTHDQEEALTMSDTVVVMDKGRILQIGAPEDIYNEPKNAFVADFIGVSNIITGHMKEDYNVSFLQSQFRCVDKMPYSGDVDVVVRPEDIDIGLLGEIGANSFSGEVIDVTFFGVHYEMLVKAQGTNWKVHSTAMFSKGEEVTLSIPDNAIHIMAKENTITHEK
ncbi:MAG: ABC transporter ATP-binding protein [Defluviitaleaceae bacterium]|nr:ABC transporter ATP-binding protein [Defluviitaleaceae bacterium]